MVKPTRKFLEVVGISETNKGDFFIDPWDVFVIKRCVIGELKFARKKHAELVNMTRHVDKNQRKQAKKVLLRMIRAGLLKKHRTNTFQWTNEGIEFAKKL
ncbi:MAG: hypothetical protein ABH986_06975 [archaeon]